MNSTREIVLARKIFGLIMSAIVAAFSLLQGHTCSSAERGSIRGRPVNIRSPSRVLPRYRPSRTSHSHHQFLELLAVHEAASSIRLERRLWSIHRVGGAHGFWEEKVGQWHRTAQTFPIPGEADDYLDKRYLRTYCVDSKTFQFLLRQTGQALQRSITRFRQPISPAKRLAMCLHRLAHGITFDQLGELYCTGASTAHAIVHAAVSVFKDILVPSAIKVPSGRELEDVMNGFRDIAQLRMCAGAVDGTFVHIKKPALWGDTYWCFKNFIAIHMLAECDHRCQFTNVDVGRAGCVGDAFSYAKSSL